MSRFNSLYQAALNLGVTESAAHHYAIKSMDDEELDRERRKRARTGELSDFEYGVLMALDKEAAHRKYYRAKA